MHTSNFLQLTNTLREEEWKRSLNFLQRKYPADSSRRKILMLAQVFAETCAEEDLRQLMINNLAINNLTLENNG